MFDQLLNSLLHLLSVSVMWIAVIVTVSVLYRLTVGRFDPSERWTENNRFLLEARSRRRL